MPELEQAFRDHFYQSHDGLRLYARDYPGPRDSSLLPVLCMHGLTRNSADFAWIADHLAKTRRVISVDQRGRGRSDYDAVIENYTPATYVGDMFTLLDELDLPRLILIGTSMGGLMSMLMVTLQPERFVAAVINDIGPELDPKGLDRIKNYVGKGHHVRTWEDAMAQTREINEVAFPRYTDEEWLRFTRGLYREVDGVPQLAYDPDLAKPMLDPDSDAVPPDLWPLFENLGKLPLLVVRGALTDILAEDCVEKMHTLAPAMHVINVDERGHAPMLDEPEVVAAIDALLGDVNPCA